MTPEYFCESYPRLFHMATAGALDQIKKYGLLSAEATLDLFKVSGDHRDKLLSKRRPRSVVLEDGDIGKFVLRDQIPLRDDALAQCLQGVSIPDWYRTLNERVFMWATQERVETLLGARAYRSSEHLILTIDTAKLVESYGDKISLSPINSGATLFNPPNRGLFTFSNFATYTKVNGARPVAEVTVKYAIPDMQKYIISSETRKAQG